MTQGLAATARGEGQLKMTSGMSAAPSPYRSDYRLVRIGPEGCETECDRNWWRGAVSLRAVGFPQPPRVRLMIGASSGNLFKPSFGGICTDVSAYIAK